MARGKQTCKILKEIRRQIAEANDIEFVTSECRYKGDCLGTCPKCEAEVRYLEQHLRKRQLAGKLVNLAGISAGAIAMLAPIAVQSQTPDTSLTKGYAATQAMADTIIVKGVVLTGDTLQDGTISREPMIGAIIINPRTAQGTSTDIDGKFQIEAVVGDSLEVKYVGYETLIYPVTSKALNEEIILTPAQVYLGEISVMGVVPIEVTDKIKNVLYLTVVNENNLPINTTVRKIERVWIDEDGDEMSDYISLIPFDGKFIIQWNNEPALQDDDGKPLKEAILRIEVEGYDNPQTIKVKYPKRNTKKTVRFKHEKKK